MMKEAVIGIVITTDKKIVITKRRDTPIWVLPGGGIDDGETPEAAVIREIKEETGLNVAIRFKCAEYLPINSLSAKTHVYECAIESGTLQLCEETIDIDAFTISELPSPFFILHQAWLKDWQTYEGKLICKAISQINYFAIFKFFLYNPIILLRFIYNKKLKKIFSLNKIQQS